jgi:hypothetical protein
LKLRTPIVNEDLLFLSIAFVDPNAPPVEFTHFSCDARVIFTSAFTTMLILAIILWTLVFAPVTAFLAGQRGYDLMTWYVFGLLLGPVGLFVSLLPKRDHEPEALFGHELQSAHSKG